MKCLALIVVGTSWLWSAGSLLGRDTEPPSAAAKQFAALVRQYEQHGRAADWANAFLDLANRHPQDPVALDALIWVLENVRQGDAPQAALVRLEERYLGEPRLAEFCLQFVESQSPLAEPLLRAAITKTPDRRVKAHAMFSLAGHLRGQLKVSQMLQTQPLFRRRFEQFYGRESARRLRDLEHGTTAAEVEQLYELVSNQYGDVASQLVQASQRQLVEMRHLTIGKPAQEIEGEAIDGTHFKLSDYRGKVVVLSFWGDW